MPIPGAGGPPPGPPCATTGASSFWIIENMSPGVSGAFSSSAFSFSPSRVSDGVLPPSLFEMP
jgi:hypothetical protein